MRRFPAVSVFALAAAADPVTCDVRLASAGKPLPGVRVRLDTRVA
jgi:hypothetical protein